MDSPGAYRTRLMGGMIGSLSALLFLVHLPLERAPLPVGWYVASQIERETITFQELERRDAPDGGTPVTRFTRYVEAPPESDDVPEEEEMAVASEEPADDAATERERSRYVEGLRALELAPNMPKIVGGIGAFYVHIDYPKEAVEQQIEGRLVLSFTVTDDGRTKDIHVMEPLHPLCDSAAVAALRDTRFIPGTQNGEPVAVRMRLPVRFRLITGADVPHTQHAER